MPVVASGLMVSEMTASVVAGSQQLFSSARAPIASLWRGPQLSPSSLALSRSVQLSSQTLRSSASPSRSSCLPSSSTSLWPSSPPRLNCSLLYASDLLWVPSRHWTRSELPPSCPSPATQGKGRSCELSMRLPWQPDPSCPHPVLPPLSQGKGRLCELS